MGMRPTSVAVLLFTLVAHSAQPQASKTDVELKEKLVSMGTADQSIREKLTPFLKIGDLKSDAFKAVAQEVAEIDARNLAELEKIVEVAGWPSTDLVGIDANNSAFLILQHSPPMAQKRLLPRFRKAVAAGKARGDHLAMLEDRIRIGDGHKQLYGTGVSAGPDGRPRLDPTEDLQNLDARRKAVGLPTIDQYLERMEKEIGTSIDRSALDPKISP